MSYLFLIKYLATHEVYSLDCSTIDKLLLGVTKC